MYFNKIPSQATRCKVHTTNFNFQGYDNNTRKHYTVFYTSCMTWLFENAQIKLSKISNIVNNYFNIGTTHFVESFIFIFKVYYCDLI